MNQFKDKDLLKNLLDKREYYKNIITFMNCEPLSEDVTIIIKKNTISYSDIFSAKKKINISEATLRAIVYELIKSTEEKIDSLINN